MSKVITRLRYNLRARASRRAEMALAASDSSRRILAVPIASDVERSNAKRLRRAIRQSLSWRNGSSFSDYCFRLYCAVLGVLWLNGNANGHSIFLLLPQLLNWALLAIWWPCLPRIL